MDRNVKFISIDSQILDEIKKRGRGAVFVPTSFLDLGSRQVIDIVLHRLVKKGTIRRLARGLYDFPKEHPVLGTLHPSTEKILEALTERDGTRIQPTGGYAANLLGLSDQVEAKVIFLTDGPSRKIIIGEWTIELRQTTPKNMIMAGRLSGLLVQALRNIGKEHITPGRIKQLIRVLPKEKRQELMTDIHYAPTWMHSIFRKLAEVD